MGKTIACIIARTGSSRLPQKVVQQITEEYSMIGYIIERVKMCKNINEIYICTTRETNDDELEKIAENYSVKIYRGSTEAVIERFISVGELTKADQMIRITGDNVFTSVEYIDEQIAFLERENLDYVRIIDVPLGATAEVMSFKALMQCYSRIDPAASQYLLMYMFDPENYKCGVVKPFHDDYSGLTITVDTIQDMERTREILSYYKKDPLSIKLSEIITIIKQHEILNSDYLPEQKVKMPFGKLITYKEFKEDMAIRESRSLKMLL